MCKGRRIRLHCTFGKALGPFQITNRRCGSLDASQLFDSAAETEDTMNKLGLGAGNGLHWGHSHIWQHVFSRRQLMKTAAGTAGLGMISGLGVPKLAQAQAGSGEPKPI